MAKTIDSLAAPRVDPRRGPVPESGSVYPLIGSGGGCPNRGAGRAPAGRGRTRRRPGEAKRASPGPRRGRRGRRRGDAVQEMSVHGRSRRA